MSSKPSRKKYAPKSSVDSEIVSRLDTLLSEEGLQNVSPLIEFIQKGYLSQVIQAWSYFLTVNEHSSFTDATIKLTKLTNICNQHLELTPFGIDLIKELLTNHSKVLFRALNSMRPSMTNPVLRLMTSIVSFKNGSLVDEFVANFDFTLGSLPKILTPTKTELAEGVKNENLSMRYNFVRFYLSLLQNASAYARKDLMINNKKIASAWLKHLATSDSAPLLMTTLEIWDEKILEEPSYKKSTKCKIFNEWFFLKTVALYNSVTENDNLKERLHGFMLKLSTDPKAGIVFHDDKAWFASTGAPLTVNSKPFKIHNKLLYTMLTCLKPWEHELQLQLVTRVLEAVPELVAPYVNYLFAINGSHDPKLSSFWIGQTLTLTNIIKLPVPDNVAFVASSTAPATTIVIDNILPPSLSKTALLKCLQTETLLVRQLSCQLLVLALQKLRAVVAVYSEQGWTDARHELLDTFHGIIPDAGTVSAALYEAMTKTDAKLLVLTLAMVNSLYSELFPGSFSVSAANSKLFTDIINRTDFQGIDLVLLDNILSLQQNDNKWWNGTNGNSLFTILLKLGSNEKHRAMALKVSRLLASLTDDTVVFSKHTLVSQMEPLLHSLRVAEADAKVWRLIDETISRSVKAPYKYLDRSKELQMLSPFVICLFEQFKFVDRKTDCKAVCQWIRAFAKYLIVTGEPEEAIRGLLSGYPELSDGIVETQADLIDASFFEWAVSSPESQLTAARLPVSEFDAVGALFRVRELVQGPALSKFQKSVIVDLLLKVGNFTYTNATFGARFVKPLFWAPLFVSDVEPSANLLFVAGLVTETLEQLKDTLDDGLFTEFAEHTVKLLNSDLEAVQNVVVKSLWSLNSTQLQTARTTPAAPAVFSALLSETLRRRILLSHEEFQTLVSAPALDSASGLVLKRFVSLSLVSFSAEKMTPLLRAILDLGDNTVRYPILRALVTSKQSVCDELVQGFAASMDDSLVVFIAASMNRSVEATAEVRAFLVRAAGCAAALMDGVAGALTHQQLLNLVINTHEFLAEDVKTPFLVSVLTSAKYTPEIPELVSLSLSSIDQELLKMWLHTSMLYVTKKLAESETLSETFLTYLTAMKALIPKLHLWRLVPKAILNAQLDVAFSKQWISHTQLLEYANLVILSGSKNIVEFEKLLQIFANNEANPLRSLPKEDNGQVRFFAAAVIYNLFHFDTKKNANFNLQEQVLGFYLGSTRADDLLLKRVLVQIEATTARNWINQYMVNWEFTEETSSEYDMEIIGEAPLFAKNKQNEVLITLNKKFISNSIKNFVIADLEMPETVANNASATWTNFVAFYTALGFVNVDNRYRATVYDAEMLLMLVVNNSEMFRETKSEEEDMVFDVRKVIEARVVEFVVLCLASSSVTVQKIAKVYLHGLLKALSTESSINDAFKDKNIFRVFFSNVLYTLQKQQTEESRVIAPITWKFVSRLVPILSNPGHFLYEKAYRFVLANNVIRAGDIPLFNSISNSTSMGGNNDHEQGTHYYREICWLLESLIDAVKCQRDLDTIKLRGVIEWGLNILNSAYLTHYMKTSILKLLERLQDLDQGSDLLVSRFGLLSYVEQQLVITEGKSEAANATTQKGTRLSREKISLEQQELNLKQVGLRLGVGIAENKRLHDWTHNDAKGFVKRVCR
ncbi:hypothetical protein BABINDRAFT_160231 [Babjeviella inositovora NRRL Y-12698]|uniref:Nucleolar pre-ribosomal-associated protein 1 C-terminal domain-containing protein n=1 Tax=Babjeviella inositovora NRRL Y-12698 TaxID=984486 RepID=A0A1E3QWK2_9ASCO|nr:uncharacterized protein BABINDRAFT_160231 [Babjeviella inositovora NRRL Y-12698]ODQ82020.1 hypothetical protein BABINDRAFT_160231 [Babjeviella inositovora NRRL Y-12698]